MWLKQLGHHNFNGSKEFYRMMLDSFRKNVKSLKDAIKFRNDMLEW